MKNLHMTHVEDMVFDGGFTFAFDVLCELTDVLNGKPDRHISASIKFDGAPAVVFGYDPSNNRAFVGTKSVFNKKIPKIAYTNADIDKFYGHDAELARKLKFVAECIRYFPSGVWQGDLMYTPENLTVVDGNYCFTPNTITYSVPVDSHIGKMIAKNKIGIVLHTMYHGDNLADMVASPIKSTQDFYDEDNNAFFMGAGLNMQKHQFTNKEAMNIKYLIASTEKMKNQQFVELERHSELLKMFINYCVRIGESEPALEMYKKFLENRNEIELAKHVAEGNLRHELLLHSRLTAIKKILIDALNRNLVYKTTVDGQAVKHEGFVVHYNGVMMKLVDRLEFSRLNFMNKKFAKAA